jgi:superfamily II DNA or RNA helicase
LKSDPTRVGLLTGEYEVRGERRRVLVRFFTGDEEFVPELGLEVVPHQTQSAAQLIGQARFGKASDLRGAITYYRLSGRLADLIYSLNATNTDFYPYQFKPVLSFLDSPSSGLLIADEVGLGKTIEAGLIWTELRARADARRLMILCPAMLRQKWSDELANRFGVSALICNAEEVLSRLQKSLTQPADSFAIISSLQGLRPPRGWSEEVAEEDDLSASARLARFLRSMEGEEPLFNLVIIDEAHYLRNPETQMARLARLVRPVAESLVLLSATPIQLRSEDLFYLLNLLDEDTFPYPTSFAEILDANAPLVELRDRLLAGPITQEDFLEVLNRASLGKLLGDSEQLNHLISHPPLGEALVTPTGRAQLAERLDRLNPMSKVLTRTRKRDVQEMRVVRSPVAYKAPMTHIERTFYEEVTQRVREFCSRYDIAEGFMLTIPQRQIASSMAAACRSWTERVSAEALDEMRYELEDDFAEDDNWRPGTLLEELIRIVHEVGDFPALRANDSKYKELVTRLRDYLREYPDNKVVLFSFYRATLHYLHERLSEDGIRSVVLHGGMEKDLILRAFGSDNGPSVLLSSEVAAEGIDLQFSSLLVNYDLPWNPMKIEQRIGRIDRIGQKADRIVIWNLMYADTIDDRIHDRLLARLDIFRQALGGTEVMLGEEIREMSYELLRHSLTPEQERARIDQTANAIAISNLQQEDLEREAVQLIAHGQYVESKIRTARDLGRFITGDDIYLYVREFFDREYPGSGFVRVDAKELLFEIDLTVSGRVDFRQFAEIDRPPRYTMLLGEPGAQRARFLFSNRVGKSSARVETIAQDHPLVRFVSAKLRTAGKGYYFPVSAVQLPSVTLPNLPVDTYMYAVDRWSITGAREIERLVFCARRVLSGEFLEAEEAEKLITSAAVAGTDWPGAPNVIDRDRVVSSYELCADRLEREFEDFKLNVERENTDRIALMISTLQSHLNNQVKKRRDIIARYVARGQTRLIPAEEGKIRQLTRRVDERVLELQQKLQLTSSRNNVSAGVIRLS